MSGPRDPWGERLPRHLGLGSAIAVLVGSTIGSGIFRVPAGVAERLHDPGPVLLAWVVGGRVSLWVLSGERGGRAGGGGPGGLAGVSPRWVRRAVCFG